MRLDPKNFRKTVIDEDGAVQTESVDAFHLSAENQALICSDTSILANIRRGKWLQIDIANRDRVMLGLTLLFWKKGNASPLPDTRVILGCFPDLPAVIAFPFAALDGEKLFLERTPGKFKTFVGGGKVDPEEIERFGIGVTRSHSPAGHPVAVEIRSVAIADAEPKYPLPAEIYVDRYGQWARRDWPGKTGSDEELAGVLRAEYADAGSYDAERPFGEGYSRYGGYEALRFDATGFFRTEYDGRRWWLVDPEGCAFFSRGLDCVLEGVGTRTDGIESLYEWLPGEGEGFDAFLARGTERGDYVDFAGINLKRVFGADWWNAWAVLTKNRMLRWGFNTIANWSSRRFIEWSGLPYVTQLSRFPSTERTVFRDFPDVFAEEYAADAKRCAGDLRQYAGDRNLIGYFLRNEPNWAFVADLNIARMLMRHPEPLESKRALIRFLREKYRNDLNNLVYVWDVGDWESWDALLKPWNGYDRLSEQGRRDLDEFSALMIGKYVEVPFAAVREADREHLCLGLRWAWVNNPVLYESCRDLGVFSINCYRESPVDRIEEAGRATDLPVMIGEFHHGGLDAGLPANGIRGVASQAERGEAYRRYVESAAADPYCVGTHYFTLNDQGILGRFDGENFQIGCVDICNRPYHIFADAVASIHAGLLPILTGNRSPSAAEVREDTVGF